MAKLSFKSQQALEDAFEMRGGYVLNFSSNTFAGFMADLDVEIYDERYRRKGSSKANCLRGFFELEPAPKVARVVRKLGQHRKELAETHGQVIPSRLDQRVADAIAELESSPSSSTEGIEQFQADATLEEIVAAIRREIEAGKHVMALDRLHTYCMKRFAFLLSRHGLTCGTSEPLHSRIGKYAKAIAAQSGHHDMTLQIVRNGFGIFEKFNDVRNNRSPAHDNELIEPSEAQFIFEFVCAYLRFVKRLEGE